MSDDQFNALTRQIGELASHVGKQGKRIDSLASQVGEQGKQIGSLASQVSKQGGRIDSLASQVGEQGERIDSLASQVAKGGEQITKHGEQIADLNNGFTKLYTRMEERFDSLESSKADRAQVDRLASAVDSLAGDVKDLSTELAATNSQLERHDRWHHQTAEKLEIELQY